MANDKDFKVKNGLAVGDGSIDSRVIIKKADNNTSDHIQFYNGTTRTGEIGSEDDTWLRINQVTAKNIYTPRYMRADGGFFVDGTGKGINGSGNFFGGTITGASDANVSNWDDAYTYSQVGHLPLAGGTMTGDITFSDDGEGIVWSRNTDGAYIKFFNDSDADTNSRLEFRIDDNTNEDFLFTSRTGETITELLRISPDGGTTGLKFRGNTVWHAGNDGDGSGLDADKLDNLEATSFLRSDANDSTSGNLTVAGVLDAATLEVGGKRVLHLPSSSTERGPWNPIVSSIRSSGKKLFADEEFAVGTNSVQVYNNSGGADVTIVREDDSVSSGGAAPNSTGKVLKISYNGDGVVSPNYGGFYQTYNSEENHTVVQIFQAKVPDGRSLNINENATGSNSSSYWLTNNAGTGKWEWYARVNHFGDGGTFSTAGHVSVSGGADVAFNWYLASLTAIDVTESIISADQLDGEDSTYYINTSGTAQTKTGDLTVDQLVTTNNGGGVNVRIGDDGWLGDINLQNTIRLSGVQDSTKGYLTFGNSDNTTLGRSGTGDLIWGGTFKADTFKGEGTVHYVEGNTSGTAGTWTGSNTNIASYYNGLIVAFKHGIAGASTTTLNINELGAKTVYRANSSKLTTHIPTGTTINYVYDSSSDAFFAMVDIDTINDYEVRWSSHITAGALIHGRQLLMEGSDGKFYPVTSGGANANSNTVSTQTMRMGGLILLYESSTDKDADAVFASSDLYTGRETNNLEYWTNHPTTEGAWATVGGPLYIVGTEDANGHFVLDATSATSFLAQALPTSDDGKIYIHLGYFGDTVDNLRFTVNNPAYQYINGQVQPYTAVPRKVTITKQASPVSENNVIPFVADATSTTGDHGLEMDTNLTYNPLTNTLNPTNIALGQGNITVPEYIDANPDTGQIVLGTVGSHTLKMFSKADEAVLLASGKLSIQAPTLDVPITGAQLGSQTTNDNVSGNYYLRLKFDGSGYQNSHNYQFIATGYTNRENDESGSLHYFRYKIYFQHGYYTNTTDRAFIKVVGDASSNSDNVNFGIVAKSSNLSNSFDRFTYLYIKLSGHAASVDVFNESTGSQQFIDATGLNPTQFAAEGEHTDSDISYTAKNSDGGSSGAVTLTGAQTIAGTKTFTANQLIGTDNELRFRDSYQKIFSSANNNLDLNAAQAINLNTGQINANGTNNIIVKGNNNTASAFCPVLQLNRNAANGSNGGDGDNLGKIDFMGQSDNGTENITYASIFSSISDATLGTIKGNLTIDARTSIATQPCKIDLLGTEREIHLHAARVHLKDTQGTSYSTPELIFDRDTDSPASGDQVGDIQFRGPNNASTPETIMYGQIVAQIFDFGDGTEDGKMFVKTSKAGNQGHVAATFSGDGLELTNDLTVDNKITFKGSAATSRSNDDFEFKIRNNDANTTVMRAGPDVSLSAYGYRLYDIGDDDNGTMALGINGSGNSFVYVDHVRGDATSSYKIDLRTNGSQATLPNGIKLGRLGLTSQTVQPYTSGTGNIGLSSSVWNYGHFNNLRVYDHLKFQDGDDIRFGNGASSSDQGGDAQLGFYGTDVEMRLASSVGNFKIKQSNSVKFTFERANGNFTAAGNVTAYSDERLKSNIKTLDSSKVLQMRGVEFIKDGKKGSGVIAQEIEKVAPELVIEGDEGYKSVAYGNLTGYLIETVKEQQKQIDELKHLVQKLLEKA